MNPRSFVTGMILGGLLLGSNAVHADSLAGQQKLLCSAQEVTVCTPDGVCDRSTPLEMQIPQFLLIDLDGKRLATTRASGENRTTDIAHMTRDGERILLQGSQEGRAFSMMISEATGLVSIAIALDGVAVGVFGACTPDPLR